MLPLIQEGDWVQVELSLQALHPGEIVVFYQDQKLVAHRVLRTIRQAGGLRLVTKGDNAVQPDPALTEAQVLGKVVAVQRGSDTRRLDTRFWRMTGRALSGYSLAWGEVYRLAQRLKRRWLGERKSRFTETIQQLFRGGAGLLPGLVRRLAGGRHTPQQRRWE